VDHPPPAQVDSTSTTHWPATPSRKSPKSALAASMLKTVRRFFTSTMWHWISPTGGGTVAICREGSIGAAGGARCSWECHPTSGDRASLSAADPVIAGSAAGTLPG
jgi:hypothetical protein